MDQSELKAKQPVPNSRKHVTWAAYHLFRIKRLGCPFVHPVYSCKVFSKTLQTNWTRWCLPATIWFPIHIVLADERLKTGNFANFCHSVLNGKRGLPLGVLYNFRMDFLVITVPIGSSSQLKFQNRFFWVNGRHPCSVLKNMQLVFRMGNKHKQSSRRGKTPLAKPWILSDWLTNMFSDLLWSLWSDYDCNKNKFQYTYFEIKATKNDFRCLGK